MVTLHTLNQSPTGDVLASCLRCVSSGDHLLLLEDGVYAGCSPYASALEDAGIHVHVLQADADARGIINRLDPAFALTDYRGFVALAAACDSVQSWY